MQDKMAKRKLQEFPGLLLLSADVRREVLHYLFASEIRAVRTTCRALQEDIARKLILNVLSGASLSAWCFDPFAVRRVNFYSGHDVTLAALHHVVQFFGRVEMLDFVGRQATDEMLKLVAQLPNVRFVSLLGSHAVTESGLAHIAALPNLEILDLSYSNVTREGLMHFRNTPSLKQLGVSTCLKLNHANIIELVPHLLRWG